MSFNVVDHNNSKRVSVIKLNERDLDRLAFPFKKHSITSLEYKPFSRFSLAKSLDEVFENAEQIAVSKYYEKLPKPWSIATKELLEDNIYMRDTEEEDSEEV